MNLSHWSPIRIEALRPALRGDFDQAALSEASTLGPIFGLLHALKQIADALGITAPPAHRGSGLSAVRWFQDHTLNEVPALPAFDQEDLYRASEDLCARQQKIEAAVYARYLRQHSQSPRMFLYDSTSTYLEGEQNELGEFGSNRDWQKGEITNRLGPADRRTARRAGGNAIFAR